MRQDDSMPLNLRDRLNIFSRLLYGSSLGAVVLCVVLWIRAKTVGEDERGNAERRALFVGLWPPTLWLVGDTLARHATGGLARAEDPLSSIERACDGEGRPVEAE
jgi:hypothetical protein